jgi:hypothetical protein
MIVRYLEYVVALSSVTSLERRPFAMSRNQRSPPKAATVPLCLLTPSMENRRIIDTHTLGLVASARGPLAPLSRALLDFAASLDLSAEIEKRIAKI